MRAEYDFSGAKRDALLSSQGRTRITIYMENAVLDEFRARAEQAGTGYQTMMNEALKGYLAISEDRSPSPYCAVLSPEPSGAYTHVHERATS